MIVQETSRSRGSETLSSEKAGVWPEDINWNDSTKKKSHFSGTAIQGELVIIDIILLQFNAFSIYFMKKMVYADTTNKRS